MTDDGARQPLLHRALLLQLDPGIAAALGEVLRTLGHEVTDARSLDDATGALRGAGCTLLVADDDLGADVLSDLCHATHPDRRLGVILLTSGRRPDLAEALPASPQVRVTTLRKPFAVAHFARLVLQLGVQPPRVPRPRSTIRSTPPVRS